MTEYIKRLEEASRLMSELGNPAPFVTVRTQDLRSLLSDVGRMREALETIVAIENRDFCGDWDEIEEARNIARQALSEGMDRASRDHEQSTTDQTGPSPSEPQTRS